LLPREGKKRTVAAREGWDTEREGTGRTGVAGRTPATGKNTDHTSCDNMGPNSHREKCANRTGGGKGGTLPSEKNDETVNLDKRKDRTVLSIDPGAGRRKITKNGGGNK